MLMAARVAGEGERAACGQCGNGPAGSRRSYFGMHSDRQNRRESLVMGRIWPSGCATLSLTASRMDVKNFSRSCQKRRPTAEHINDLKPWLAAVDVVVIAVSLVGRHPST